MDTAFRCLPEPGLREATTRLPSQDEPASVSSPRPGPARRELRRPPDRGWTCRWLSSCHLPPTAWDALSWGALAVLALQLARQVQFRARSPESEGTESDGQRAHLSCARPPARRLLQDFALRRNVLPEARVLRPSPTSAQGSGAEPPLDPPESGHSRTAEPQGPRGEDPGVGSFLDVDPGSGLEAGVDQGRVPDSGQERAGPEGSLEEAAMSLQKLFQLSIALVLNVLGTESMRQGRCGSAFSCFRQAAARGYAKAQYNAGLCLELGRGTGRDLSQALLYYQRAANRGHLLAQYRYARCLLQEPAAAAETGLQEAASTLERLAEAGLTEAQAFLGVWLILGPDRNERRAVHFFRLAAANGDPQSQYHLGVCHERGLGVQQDVGAAVRCYQQAAAQGSQQARERLSLLLPAPGTGTASVGRRCFSSPSLRLLDPRPASGPFLPAQLPHSWSTGSLGLPCGAGDSAGAGTLAFGHQVHEGLLVRLGFG
ncbi:death ligand signal enhancer isoform X2 [Tachyglossus aculeatus]|uniref:death ligand signal enhancer isoform X2 n=1 Tax=Tachyglossus aculeatus TaxID=9261 RepID=UPI0018F645E1|nr:death ligand signal enhancer isoform X2 [Tachyglossus aculeatus]